MKSLYFLSILIIFFFFSSISNNISAVPQHWQDFHPSTDSTLYGLVVVSSEKEKEDSYSVMKYSAVVALNLTSLVRAKAYWNASLREIGWNYLHVTTEAQQESSSSKAYFYAGIIEGILTWEHILTSTDAHAHVHRKRFSFLKDEELYHRQEEEQKEKEYFFSPSSFSNPSKEKNKKNKKNKKFNFIQNQHTPCSVKFAQDQLQFLQTQIKINKNNNNKKEEKEEKYWSQVNNLLNQLEGLAVGVNTAQSWIHLLNFTLFDLYAINLDDEWNAIEEYCGQLSVSSSSSSEKNKNNNKNDKNNNKNGKNDKNENYYYNQKMKNWLPQHCSAAVVIRQEDVYAGQVVWSPFSIMYRVFKTYDFGGSDSSTTIIMSSYPAFVHSADDFVTTSKKLVIQETTNGNFNNDLWKNMKPQTVPEFLRYMIGSYQAETGEEFVKLYGKYVSGTYNNQLMITDFKRFTPQTSSSSSSLSSKKEEQKHFLSSLHQHHSDSTCKNLSSGLLWVLEQYPCGIESQDVTHLLETTENCVWKSYNIPFFKKVYNLTGFAEMEKRFGKWFSYNEAPRAQIFRKHQDSVKNLETFFELMRSNNFENEETGLIQNCEGCPNNGVCDPKHTGMNAISSRGDLTRNVSGGCYGPLESSLRPQSFGGLDAKVFHFKSMKDNIVHAVSSPTNLQQPTFCYPKDDIENLILPKCWNFPVMKFFQP